MVKITSGRSYDDRITFSDYSTKATAIRRDEGKIEIEYEEEEKENFSSKIITILWLIFYGFLDVYWLLPAIAKSPLIVYGFCLSIAIFYVMWIIFCIALMRQSENRNLIKNHGAEHMVNRAYCKLKRIPTVSEAKRFSRINYQCGINMYSATIIAEIIAICIYQCTGYVISGLLLVQLAPLLFKIFPFNLVGLIAQFWTTDTPDDSNIELAIAALQALEEKELLKEK